MDIHFDASVMAGYHSKSEIARVLTENWASQNLFCPKCGCTEIKRFENNRPVADFCCPNCGEQYELKSKNGAFGKKVNGGAYETMIKRIVSFDSPNFLFMSYSMENLSVNNLTLVPKFFFVPNVIEKRKPLANTARRAGWVGCNILLEQIPVQGRIQIITNGCVGRRENVISQTQKTQKLQLHDNITARSWLFDILKCINSVETDEFKLSDIYQFEPDLARIHPENHNIKPKIRQQLQILRDRGMITFLGQGRYKKCP